MVDGHVNGRANVHVSEGVNCGANDFAIKAAYLLIREFTAINWN